jgi:ribosome-associated protein
VISEVQRRMKDLGGKLPHIRHADSGWVVVDYVHVVVHVFSQEAREYYAIEKLWATATEIPLPQF